ncbi:hypothetical protein G6F57_006489 [Rhizopus arrhizus]|uniref:Vacuolar protein sorting-associated protein 51 homolog n=1 Tax=Rhizopus oryzae TaxID=64495 RepID=A0A9P6XCC1_RHIOR|nr:hypothetical protein G6F23_002926 [Rhizopus arrhizus]KAG1420462.1 hypothetical protein G6F58_004176 [Rhizopus delemar]KAG0762746.1 hypothetical protein G6F24_006563 [Rhizopus arrhizus]KAG0789124.1 hypothetical protein G6F21_006729 [Rhizopus arrhizus]KAG0790580.1 hypothetical protein G6F22_006369 [Rhizopus arrhizus]
MENAASVNRKTNLHERNSILKKYYGINGKPTATTTQPEERPFDLEIREIDGDMKTLVYENYNKFISATDTIRKMRSNVENMESEMSRLNENIANISSQSKRINETLGPNRTKIQQLSTTHNSLKRLQFIFDLPNRLQYYSNKQKYAQAIRHYTKTKQLLDHTVAFKGIEKECSAIMEKVKGDIWTEMQQEKSLVGNVKLLILLGEDKHKLQREYIQIQTAIIKRKQNEQQQSVDDLMLYYITPLNDMVNNFKELLLTEEEEKEKEEAKEYLLGAINPLIDEFFVLVSKLTQLPIAISNHATALASITKINERMTLFDSKWKDHLIYTLLRTALFGFKERIRKFICYLNETKQTDTDRIAQFIQDIQTWLTEHLIKACLLPLKGYFDEDSVDYVRNGLRTVWNDIVAELENIQPHYTTMITHPSSVQLFMFVISRLCYDLAENCIIQVYSTFSYEFYTKNEFRYRAPNPDAPLNPTIVVDMKAMIEKYMQVGQYLLNQQMMQDGYLLSSKIQEAYLFKNTSNIVNKASSIWTTLAFERLKQIEKSVTSIFPQKQQSMVYEHESGIQSAHSLVSSDSVPDLGRFGMETMMNYNIDKLFAERIEIYRQVEPTPVAVYHGLLRIVLKAFLEVTRQIQMDTATFQQIQVDVEYIGRIVWPTAGEEKWTTTLLQEIISSAYSRCELPKKLSSDELEAILIDT